MYIRVVVSWASSTTARFDLVAKKDVPGAVEVGPVKDIC